ncbi:MAG: uL30 family ribosomal protein [Candidatus Pacearchaeota archaeon]
MKIAIVRIGGQAKKPQTIKETLQRLNLPRKFSCVIIDGNDPVKMGMFNAVEMYVAYGEISEEFANEIAKKRDKKDKKYFSLHPPVGGFKKSSKVIAPKGILGEHEDISKFIERML